MYEMKNDDEKKKPSLVDRHALDRLDEVEKDKRKAYTKPDDYYTEDEKNLYYVVCTRAQHQLVVYNQPQYVLEKPKMLVRKK